ncbi:hypothetical protein O181_076769 [Austropuccinia psidii MF-1]|uniref:Uncharacterized protein n=1 Tax=Austropuccinia psidii MF-1 TaxID=1389203 RepID=A0A9Q3IFQ3_9BASI|nr:hypothetical protein [Austropuccinia psidii MF-1]
MPIISEPELEPSMSNSNRYESHSEDSNRHLYEPLQEISNSVKGKGLGNVSKNPSRSDELLEHPEKGPQKGENSDILQWMESTIIQTSNKKDKEVPFQKREARKKEFPVASTSNS